ncbi:reverse transcriptase domain-containing protein, partial [Tanacetum coccineum]
MATNTLSMCGEDKPEITLLPRKRLGIDLGLRCEVGESSAAAAARPITGHRADYGFVDTVGAKISRQRAEEFQYRHRGYLRCIEETQATHRSQNCDPIDAQQQTNMRQVRDCSIMDIRSYPTGAACVDFDIDAVTTGTGDSTAGTVETLWRSSTASCTRRDGRYTDENRAGDDSHTSGTGVRRTERIAQECTYQDFMKCQPLYFKGTEGVATDVVENFPTLGFWSLMLLYVKTYVMTWTELKKKMADKYCPRNEMKKLEAELWNLEVQESDKVERYVGGLPDMIHKSVVASKPKTMQEATEMATELMDKKIRTFAKRQVANKRKFKDTSRNNQNQQQPFKRQNVARAYAAASGDRKPYEGSKPLCPKCNYNHDGPCTPRCYKCNKVGNFAHDCKSTTNANVANNQRDTGMGQKPTCHECGAQGHFKRYCPKLNNNNNNNNNNRGNQVGTGNAQAKVYDVGNAGTNLDANVITGMFLLNNHYASVLFDIGVDRSFVYTAFSSQIDI